MTHPHYRSERLRGYAEGRTDAMMQIIGLLLQHNLDGCNHAVLQINVRNKLRDLTDRTKELRTQANSLRSNISVDGQTQMYTLLGRIDGIYDIITLVKSVAK